MSAPVQSWAEEELTGLGARGLLRQLEPLSSPQGAEVELNGEERLVNFSSNDYLGLANDAAVKAAAERALKQWGLGSGASRLITGDTLAHRALERAAAGFEGTEAALLFSSGSAANLGVLSVVCGEGDVIFSDALNHASLVDGCRLSRAKAVIYPHRDVAALGQLLLQHPARRALVVTDAIFSMDGDRAPLRELAALCESAGAALLVDEAHATGVCGPTGAGLCEELGVAPELRVVTLSKALGGFGAYVACSHRVREWLFNRARSVVFSTALPAALCAGATAAIARVRTDRALRERLWRNIRFFAAGLAAAGRPSTALGVNGTAERPSTALGVHGTAGRPSTAPGEAGSAIFPVVLGSPEAAVAASKQLRARGLLVKAIRPPTVPPGTSRLRFAISAAHTEAQLSRALEALKELPR